MPCWGLGFRAQGVELRVLTSGLGLRLLRIEVLGFRLTWVRGEGLDLVFSGFRVEGLEAGLGCQVRGEPSAP